MSTVKNMTIMDTVKSRKVETFTGSGDRGAGQRRTSWLKTWVPHNFCNLQSTKGEITRSWPTFATDRHLIRSVRGVSKIYGPNLHMDRPYTFKLHLLLVAAIGVVRLDYIWTADAEVNTAGGYPQRSGHRARRVLYRTSTFTADRLLLESHDCRSLWSSFLGTFTSAYRWFAPARRLIPRCPVKVPLVNCQSHLASSERNSPNIEVCLQDSKFQISFTFHLLRFAWHIDFSLEIGSFIYFYQNTEK